MADISTKVRKLNIFKQIKLGYYRNRIKNASLTIDEINNLPEYIKNDDTVVDSIVWNNQFSDSDLRKLDYRKICQRKHEYEFIKEYPTDVRFDLFEEEVISPYLYTEEQRMEFLLDLIHEGKPNALQEIHWGYMPEVDKNIKKVLEDNGEEELSDSLLQYFDSNLLLEMTREDPSVIAKLNLRQQKEYAKHLRKYIDVYLKDTYRLSEYASTRLDCLQYLDKDVRMEVSKYLINSMKCYETIKFMPESEARSFLKSIYQNENRLKGMETLSKLAPHLSGAELAFFTNTNQLEQEEKDMIIDSITSEEEIANYFSSYRVDFDTTTYGKYQREKVEQLFVKYKKFDKMFKLSEENRSEMETEFMKLPVEERRKYANNNEKYIQYLPCEDQIKLAESDMKLLAYCNIDAKKKFLKDNPKEFVNFDQNTMLELVAEDTRLYNFLPENTKLRLISRLKDEYVNKAMIALLRRDIRNSKLLMFEKDSRDAVPELMGIFSGIENESEAKIKDYFLHSKFTSALGKLSLATDILHGRNGGEEIKGIDGYCPEQIKTIQKLSSNQVKELVNVDVNYVLPYLTGEDVNNLRDDEIDASKNRAKELFISIYGQKKYEEYKECFETIYNLQQKSNDKIKKSSFANEDKINDYDSFKKRTEIPLEEFKILFNNEILSKCESEQIKEYFRTLSNDGDTSKEFLNIIKTTYGDRATNILKSRSQLNVHSINSLEIFNNDIIENYGEAFVHDSITYNLRDFSEFLEAQKNPETAEAFKNYYGILTEVYGENVETMQRAISEFSYYKDLLLDTRDKDLSNEQVLNLLNVICSEKNNFNIQTLDQLNHYNEFANQELQEIIDNSEIVPIDYMKTKLCKNLLGMRYGDNMDLPYGDSVITLNILYDFSSDESEKSDYTDTEKRFMNIINYIYQEQDKGKFIEFIKNVKNSSQMRNIPAFRQVIDKVQERELNELNHHITTTEELDRVCEQEKDMENPSIYKEQIDGVNVYHLNGYKYCMFGHEQGTISDEDLFSYEGQGGNSAICSRVVTPNMGIIHKQFLYGRIPSKGIITIYNNDASTQHMPKRTKMHASHDMNVKQIDRINYSGNEMAMYRRKRDHSEISNENSGGRIAPMAYGISDSADLSGFVKRFKGTGIAIFVRHEDKYKEKENIEVKEDNER